MRLLFALVILSLAFIGPNRLQADSLEDFHNQFDRVEDTLYDHQGQSCDLQPPYSRPIRNELIPRFFGNVEKIYVMANITGNYPPELASLPFLRIKPFQRLVACVLHRISNANENTTVATVKQLPKRIFIVHDLIHRWDDFHWQHSLDKGSLIVVVTAELSDERLYEGLKEKLIILHARYFRPGVSHLLDTLQTCARPVPYTSDSALLNQRLTHALYSCLDKPYVDLTKQPK